MAQASGTHLAASMAANSAVLLVALLDEHWEY